MGCVTSVQKENTSINKVSPGNHHIVADNDTDDEFEKNGNHNHNHHHHNNTYSGTSPHSDFDTKSLPETNYLIQILRATDIPKMDIASESDPYVKLKILNTETETQKGDDIVSLYRMDNPNPTWNCYRTFSASEFHDTLRFELWEKDFAVLDKDDFIGYAQIMIKEIYVNVCDDDDNDGDIYGDINNDNNDDEDEDEDCLQEIDIILKKDKHTKKHNTKLYFKLFALPKDHGPNMIERKTIFFIRHGESEWNSAQHKKNVHKMYKQVDHPLNIDGIQQAINFNKLWKQQTSDDNNDEDIDPDLNEFLSAQIIYSSPLCRATQTALLTCLDHPIMNKKGIVYARNLREIKTMGGADTLANKTGNEQYQKAIDNIIKHKADLSDKIKKIHIDYNDSSDNQKWWSSSVDKKKHFHLRLMDFMYYIRYSNEHKVICVGHSLWFKGFCKKYINKIQDINQFSSKKIIDDLLNDDQPIFADDDKHPNHDNNDNEERKEDENVEAIAESFQNRQSTNRESVELMNDLQTKKVENAGCVRVDIAFSDKFENGLKIEDVKLLFGTQLIGKH